MRSAVIMLLLAAALCGCAASNEYCMEPQPYMKAETLPPLQVPQGLSLPQSTAALTIPPPPDHYVPYGRKLPDPKAKGGERVDCLDQPPMMPPAITGTPPNSTPLALPPTSEQPSPAADKPVVPAPPPAPGQPP